MECQQENFSDLTRGWLVIFSLAWKECLSMWSLLLLNSGFSRTRLSNSQKKNRISYIPAVNQAEVCSLSSLNRYTKNIYHIGRVSQDSAQCRMVSI
jgi:hypothetical protein